MNKEIIDTDLFYNEPTDDDGIPMHNVSTVGLGKISKHKQETDKKIAKKLQELEDLEYMYKELEEKKSFLEKLSEHQHIVEKNRRSMILRLGKTIVLLNKQEQQLLKYSQLVEQTRLCFQKTFEELKSIDNEKWIDNEQEFSEELAAAAALVEASEKEYTRLSRKLLVAGMHVYPDKLNSKTSFIDRFNDEFTGKSFAYIFKAGLVFALPMGIILILFLILISIFN